MRELFSDEAEHGVLGAVLQAGLQHDAGLVEDILGQMTSGDFYHDDNAALFEAMVECNDRSMPIDPVTVGTVRRTLPSGDLVIAYAAELASKVPSAANWKAYAKHVKEWGVIRHIIDIGGQAKAMVQEGAPTDAVIAASQQAMADLRDLDGETKAFKRLDQWMGDAADLVDEKHRGVAPKWPATGLDKLDELVQGVRPKKVTVIAGLPGSGKTTLALQIAQHNAVKERKPWLVFSIEMPGEELGLRAIASLGGVSLQKLDNPSKMAEDDWARMGAAVAQALEAPLFVCDDPVQTPATIRATARQCQREHGLAGIVVDYLTLVRGDRAGRSRSEEVGKISKALLQLAKEMAIPVIELAQLNRDRGLSAKRKASAKSALDRHLAPRLGELPLAEVSKQAIDQALMWPMQERYALSFVRSVYGVLSAAFRQALRLDLLPNNPMAALKFTDFVRTRIRPKPARLRGDDVPGLLVVVTERFEVEPAGCMLALMMLCHGSRLGETRLARWRNINLDARRWFLPAGDTKTKAEHTLPLTDQACALLRRYRDLQAAQGYTGPLLFPGSHGAPLSPSKANTLFTDLAKGEWSSHDLRKVARTAWTDLGVDYMVGELLLNHAMKDLDATYIHTTAEGLKRRALEAWHGLLDQQGFNAIHTGTLPGHKTEAATADATVGAACSAPKHPSQGRMHDQEFKPGDGHE